MRASARFHANHMNLPVRGKTQQLRSREVLAHNYRAAFVQTYQMKTRLAEINADRVYVHGMPPSFIFFYSPAARSVKAADHAIINKTDIRVARYLWTTVRARSKRNGEEAGRIGNGKSASVR